MKYTTPVLLLLYNRPDTSKQVFEEIRKIRPAQLFIAADGPSEERLGDVDKCRETRSLVDTIDWECELKTLFHDDNLGCRKAISSSISWFFENVEEGIILEDDCLPSQSFFIFCNELLERYKSHNEVMVISGDNFQSGRRVSTDSYYFSRYPHCWGWATWRRAWQKYDTKMSGWQSYLKSREFLNLGAVNPAFKAYWKRNFERVLSGEVDSWAYVWTYSCWVNNGLTAIPEKNLVKNIGFGPDATHTKGPSARISAMQAGKLDFPLRHPVRVERHLEADSFTDAFHFGISAEQETRPVLRLKKAIMHSIQKLFGSWSYNK